MKIFLFAAAALSLLAPSMASAQGHGHGGWGQEYGGGHNFRNGEHMGHNDWNSAQPVDYRQHHLRRPPHGYEWRQSNGQYILAAVATGAILSAILSNGR